MNHKGISVCRYASACLFGHTLYRLSVAIFDCNGLASDDLLGVLPSGETVNRNIRCVTSRCVIW